MKRLFVFAIMVMSLASLSAKEKIEKVKVRGEYTLLTTADVTFKQAAAEALKDAKRKAIEKVCGETVNVWDRMSTSNVGESFNSLSLNQINGELVEYTVIKEWREDSKVRSVEVLFYCEIEAKVKKGLTPDPNFTADIDRFGIASFWSFMNTKTPVSASRIWPNPALYDARMKFMRSSLSLM